MKIGPPPHRMAPVKCPAPNCAETFQETLDSTVLLRLLDLHAQTAHPPTVAPQATPPTKAEKVRRPSITQSGNSEDWSYFLARWQEYKQATRLQDNEVLFQLMECCEETLRKDLTRSYGSLTDRTEAEALNCIRSLAVKPENILVARMKLLNLRQDRDEAVRSYAARLRGQAGICRFIKTKTCTCEREISIEYSDDIIRDTLIRGLEDDEIRLDVLGQCKQDDTLDDTLLYIEAKESGKRSAGLLNGHTVTTANATSSYKRASKQLNRPTNSENHSSLICSHCGQRGHGNGTNTRERSSKCPAYNHVCKKCEKRHHYEQVCRNTARQQHRKQDATQDAVFQDGGFFNDAVFESESLCATENKELKVACNTIVLDHHIFNEMTEAWQKSRSSPQPCIPISFTLHPSDIRNLGFTPAVKNETCEVTYNALADTGCQSCLGGIELLAKMGLSKQNLLPVTMHMTAANNKGINIIGALPLCLSGKSPSGSTLSTRQIVYFTDSTHRFFLSKLACINLGIISKSFPTIGETLEASDAAPSAESAITRTCQCPKRQMPPPRPNKLPYPPTVENREKLEKYLLDYYKSSTFNVCQHQTLPMMTGPPLRIMINDDAKPVASHKPTPVPVHWQKDVYAGLDQDVNLGVIEPVPVGTPVTWCHRMVVIPKKSGKPRRTVDLQALNKHATRETHHTESPFHQARAVPPNTYKTVSDAWNGYHSIPLHEDDRHMTTFITPRGRYRYRVAPQGYLASGDGYTRRFDEIVMDIPRKTKCVDDTLMWDSSIEEAFFHTIDWLDICGSNGISLNPLKFVFAKEVVEFAGFEITTNSVRPSAHFLESIRDFPTPKTITDIRSWFGLVNQVSYAFASAQRMQPFRELLKPGKIFEWTDHMEKLFGESKDIIMREIREGVEIYDKTRPTCLLTDWSKDGIGSWLLQKHCNCNPIKPLCCKSGWKVTLAASRFTSSAESRYAPIEGEALAVVDALKKHRHFVLGCSNLIIAVDHKPLLKIFSDRSLEDITNPRLLNLKEKTLQFRFQIVHVPGIRHHAADAISRHPTGESDQLLLPDDIAAITPHSFLSAIRSYHEEESEVCAQFNESMSIIESITFADVRIATTGDQLMSHLLELIEEGFPDSKNNLHPELKQYFQFRDNLTTLDGVIFYRDRIVIPPSLRAKALSYLHSAHQSVTQMTSRAEGSFFWPGITSAINDLRTQCTACSRIAPSQPSLPPTPPVLPLYPFQAIAADYFQYIGQHYLVAVDRYSNWPIVEHSANGAQGLITALKKIFTTFGIAEEITSDGGPEFTANATETFLHNWGVHHRLSSVSFPHSNCRAELAVKSVKRLLMENTGPGGTLNTDKFQCAILQYRNTPERDTGLSPAMCVFGRAIRDFIPVHPGRYLPHPAWRETLVAREEALRNRHHKICERLTEHTRDLPPLKVGDHVRIQNQSGVHPTKWDRTGIIVEVRQYHQYIVHVDGSGRVTLRNRKFLRKYTPVVMRNPLLMRPDYPSTLPSIKTTLTPHVPQTDNHPATQTNIKTMIKQPVHNTDNPVPTPTKPVVQLTPNAQYTQPNAASPEPPHLSNFPESPSKQAGSPGSTPARVNTRIFRRSLTADPTAVETVPKSPKINISPSPPGVIATQKLPLALRQLQPHNKSGLSEIDLPVSDKRVTRQNTVK